ncbi:MAG: LysR substrate-binding domain-containing protein [Proteobacteria bacterium]|nr:LysR substrate-binding domain-containing protein [Pseudomonadota bacterium]
MATLIRPTVRQLEYLVAVAEHLHFRRAAEACAVSQPALSAQIQQFEDLLGLAIFERDRRRVLLTEAGREIIDRALHILAQIDSLADVARRGAEPLVGRLDLGVIPTIAPYLLPRVLPAVRQAYPDLRLVLREDLTDRLVAQLAAGKLDLLLLALPVDASFVGEMLLFEEPFLLAAPTGHELASREIIAESELAGRSVLLLEDGHCLRDQALSVCRAAGAEESAGMRATSLNTLTQMVASGLGITLLPGMAVDTEVSAAQSIAIRPFAAPVPSRKIGLMWRESSPREHEFGLLGELVARAAME